MPYTGDRILLFGIKLKNCKLGCKFVLGSISLDNLIYSWKDVSTKERMRVKTDFDVLLRYVGHKPH